MISDAVQAYLADLDTERRVREQRAAEDALEEPWFHDFDEKAHATYEKTAPTRLARLGAWLRTSR